jgi:hypothetical protein
MAVLDDVEQLCLAFYFTVLGVVDDASFVDFETVLQFGLLEGGL